MKDSGILSFRVSLFRHDVNGLPLTLKAPTTTAADDIHKYFSFFFLSEKIRIDVSSESSARQRIHMKNQALFSLKDKSKKSKCHLLQFFFWRFKGLRFRF